MVVDHDEWVAYQGVGLEEGSQVVIHVAQDSPQVAYLVAYLVAVDPLMRHILVACQVADAMEVLVMKVQEAQGTFLLVQPYHVHYRSHCLAVVAVAENTQWRGCNLAVMMMMVAEAGVVWEQPLVVVEGLCSEPGNT